MLPEVATVANCQRAVVQQRRISAIATERSSLDAGLLTAAVSERSHALRDDEMLLAGVARREYAEGR